MWEVNTVSIGKIVVNAFNGLELMLARLRKDYGENRVTDTTTGTGGPRF